jgi:hypothetical protein
LPIKQKRVLCGMDGAERLLHGVVFECVAETEAEYRPRSSHDGTYCAIAASPLPAASPQRKHD